MDVSAYLDRIGYDGPLDTGAATLAALHRAHLLSVPFDALDPYLGREVPIGPEPAYTKVVGANRGGFCFELNGLFAWLLSELGFAVTHLAARPQFGPDFLAPERAHLVLLVPADGRRWVTDVGFGFPWALEPLDLDERGEQESGGRRFRIEAGAHEEEVVVHHVDAPGPLAYRLELPPLELADFAGPCHDVSTREDAVFVTQGPVVKLFPRGWVRITAHAIGGERAGRPFSRELADREEWRAALAEQAGLVVDGTEVRGA